MLSKTGRAFEKPTHPPSKGENNSSYMIFIPVGGTLSSNSVIVFVLFFLSLLRFSDVWYKYILSINVLEIFERFSETEPEYPQSKIISRFTLLLLFKIDV